MKFCSNKIKNYGKAFVPILSAVVLIIAGLLVYTYPKLQRPDIHSLQHATPLYNQNKEFPTFNMLDHNGNSFTQQNLQNHWSFIFFGFTHCPDICPITMNVIDQTIKSMNNPSLNVQTIFVTVDPKRDTTEKLKEYVSHFGSDVIGLRGQDEELSSLTQKLGIIYYIPDNPEKENYLVDHSSQVLLVGPNGKFAAIFSAPHDALAMAHDFKIISAYLNYKNS